MIVVTGSLGYIGSVLMPYLINNGHGCRGYDTGFFRDCTLFNSNHDDKTIIKDMRSVTKEDLKGAEAVIHLAGISNDPFGDLDAHRVYDPTRDYSLKLAGMCKDMGIKFVFASSCSVYGKGSDGILNEESTPSPQTPYSLNKLQIENGLKGISGDGFNPIMLRFATVFGMSPRIRFDVFINMFIGMALTNKKIVLNSDGKAWRPNVHILDVCKAIELSTKLNPDGPLVLNVGDDKENYQIIDIAKMVSDAVPGCGVAFLNKTKEMDEKEELIRDRKVLDGVDKRTYRVSFQKIRNTIRGFSCDWTVSNGISSIIKGLEEVGFSENDFSNKNYYRLQKIESMYNNKLIDDNLYWTRRKDGN